MNIRIHLAENLKVTECAARTYFVPSFMGAHLVIIYHYVIHRRDIKTMINMNIST